MHMEVSHSHIQLSVTDHVEHTLATPLVDTLLQQTFVMIGTVLVSVLKVVLAVLSTPFHTEH